MAITALVMILLVPATAINVSATVQDKIPDYKLMDRPAAQWEGQYKNPEEFTMNQNTINDYVNAKLQNNGWNQVMQKDNIRIHNFDTMIGKMGYGYELVALSMAKEKLLGTYNATGPLAKFHDWVLSKYTVPTSIEGIDARMAAIVPANYLQLVPQDVATFDEMAAQGSVAPELHQQEPSYWTMVANVAVCKYDINCDHTGMEHILNKGLYKGGSTTIPAMDISSLLLPKAYAITYVDDEAYLYADPQSCDYGICYSSDTESGTAPVDTSIFYDGGGNDGHAYGALSVYGSSCTTTSGASTEITGTVDEGSTWNFDVNNNPGASCAINSNNYDLGNDAPYQWTVTATNYAWTS